jgi:ketosteroid isomerase-like protein
MISRLSQVMTARKPCWVLVVLGLMPLLTACDGMPTRGPAQPVVDIEQERQALFQQDMRFADVAYKEGVAEAYRRFMAADAIQLPDGGFAIEGRELIYEDLLAITGEMDFSLTWEPVKAEVAASGDLGYTWGFYYYEAVDEMGAPFVAEGKYVYLWRKNNDRWELILDITNQTEPYYELTEAEPVDPAEPDLPVMYPGDEAAF